MTSSNLLACTTGKSAGCLRAETGLIFRIVGGCGQENADAPHALALLRARRQWPCGRAAEQRYELAAFHVGHGLTPSQG
jgi:hypothetical protein